MINLRIFNFLKKFNIFEILDETPLSILVNGKENVTQNMVSGMKSVTQNLVSGIKSVTQNMVNGKKNVTHKWLTERKLSFNIGFGT